MAWRAGAVGALLTGVAGAATAVLATMTVGTWPGLGVVDTERALATVLLVAATAACAWSTGVLALGSITVVRVGVAGRTPTTPVGGRAVGRVCVLLLALAGTTSGPAVAVELEPVAVTATDAAAGTASGGQQSVRVGGTPSSSTDLREDGRGDLGAVPQPGWTPTPPVPGPRPVEQVGLVTTVPREAPTERVVVRRGDTLWALCARHLGPQAGTADIAEEWPRWYAANAGVIGPDPDLILPGQELVVPARGATS